MRCSCRDSFTRGAALRRVSPDAALIDYSTPALTRSPDGRLATSDQRLLSDLATAKKQRPGVPDHVRACRDAVANAGLNDAVIQTGLPFGGLVGLDVPGQQLG